MKPISVLNKLTESESKLLKEIRNYPDWIKEELADGKDVTAWYCNNCNKYFEEPYSERTNMEAYYGVSSMFPDSHYQDLIMCPYCKNGLEEKNIYFDSVAEIILWDNDLSNYIGERFEKENPDIVGEYYRQQGTHHCDIFEDHPEYADEIIKELFAEGKI